MTGYCGASRSVRSCEAINSFEVPLSMIKRQLIDKFLETQPDSKRSLLSGIPVKKWKNVAKRIGPTSWHHTSSYFNKTDHYNLDVVAEELLSDNMSASSMEGEDKATEIFYGIIKVHVWGGSRHHPKLIGEEEHIGVVVGEWLYYKEFNSITIKTKRCRIAANKVIFFEKYRTYEDFVAENRRYKNTKKIFNAIIKERTKHVTTRCNGTHN